MAEAMEGATNCSLRMLSLSVSPPLCLSVSLFLSLSSLSLSLSLVCFLIAPGLPAQGFHDPELSGHSHQLPMKKIYHRLGRGIFSVEIPSSKLTLARVKST